MKLQKEKMFPLIRILTTNDLSYVIKKKIIQIREAMNGEENCISNVPQPIVESIIIGWTNSEGSRAILLAPASSLLLMIPLESPSMVLGGTNFEKTRTPPFVPNVAPPAVPLSASRKVTQQMVHLADHSRILFKWFLLWTPRRFFTNISSNGSTLIFYNTSTNVY